MHEFLYFCIIEMSAYSRMKRLAIYIISLFILCSACTSHKARRQLEEIERLVLNESFSKAWEAFPDIDPADLHTAADSALYSYINAYLCMVFSDTFPDAAAMYATAYYKRHPNPQRLAMTDYATSWTLYERGDRHQAMLLMKEAERLFAPRDSSRMYDVYHSLTCFNQEAGEYRGTLKYGRKALEYAKAFSSTDVKVRTMIQVIMAYMALNNTDSALICAREIEPVLLNQINEYSTYYYLTCLADLYYPVNRKKAIWFLNKALEYDPDVEAFRMVGKVYFDNGDYAKAEEYYNKSLDPRHPEVVVPAMEGLIEIAHIEKRYEDMDSLSKSLLAFKDSVENARREQRMAETQTAFDANVREAEQTSRLYLALAGIAILILCIIGGWLFYRRRQRHAKRQLDSARQQIETHEKRLEEMTAEGADKRKEIKSLQKKIETLTENNTETFKNGKRRYDEILAGGTSVTWSKTDFADFIAYYKIVDAAFVTHLERDYNNLSTRYMFAAILQNMGFTDDEIERIMAIAGSSLRSIRSRIRSEKAS